ncbi:MAG TPA: efflux RND transporter periplasmic adaptor subunit [Planctomycetaceae bacterium]
MRNRILIAVTVVACVAAVAGGAMWAPRWWQGKPDGNADEPSPAKSPTTVVLTPEKFATLKIRCEPAARRELQETCVVPGRLEYRRVKRVEVKAPVEAVIQEVKVKPGAAVEAGTPLALLTSPGVGLARAEVEKSESDLRIANHTQEWNDAIARNLGELQAYLREKPRSQEVEEKFNDKLLGDHRQNVLPAYTEFIRAQKLWDANDLTRKSGSISEQKARQFEADRDKAWESFLSVCEQSEYDAWQAREKAMQNRTYARRMVDVNKQKLATLLGEFSKPENSDDSDSTGAAEITRFFMVAPFAGTVEQRLASDSQRVEAGTLLFVVANTDVLEVSAEVREGDWPKVAPYLRDGEGKTLKISVSALGEDREFEATIDYVGRYVDDQNKAVPVMALLDNSRRELVPGMFARIQIPAGQIENELVVPPAALRTNDRQDFVFIADDHEKRTYHRVDVQVGKRTPEWVTIASGLSPGQRVVVEGANALKNELLLERDEE